MVFHEIYILVLRSLNLHLTFQRYRLYHHTAYSIFLLFHFLFDFLFHLFLVLSMVPVFFISFNILFKPLSSSLNSLIIIYFFEGAKELIVYFDLVPKSLYLFVSDSAELYSISTWLDKLDFFLKIRSSVLNFAFLSFVDRLCIFVFYTE